MFGYVIADRDNMSDEQVERYRAVYCGLCRSLKSRHGSLARLTLNYDMTFLVLLLSSMCEPEEEQGTERCFMHPINEHVWCVNRFTDYAADMTVALAYLNFLDDWRDERRVIRRAEAGALRGAYERVKERYPQRCAYIEERIGELSELESLGETDPDAGARCFGRLLGEVFDYGLDELWGQRVRRLGEELGEFVYVMDAVVDLPEDRTHGRYNPLSEYARDKSEEELRAMLTMLIGEAAALFEHLPLVKDVDIMRNVLYSGVWLRYNMEMEKRNEKEVGAAVEP